MKQTTIERVSMGIGSLSFSSISYFLSSLKAPLKQDVPVEKSISPVLSERLKSLTGADAQRTYGLIEALDGLVKFNAARDYQLVYSSGVASETLSLKWSVWHSHDDPGSCPSGRRGEGYFESFLLDLMRSKYQVSSADGYCRFLDQASVDQRLRMLETCGLPFHDLARVSEIAHQGHLAETVAEALEHNFSDGTHSFAPNSVPPVHEINMGGQEAVQVTSTTSYVLKDLDTGKHVCGLVLSAKVTSRIGYLSGKLDHAALMGELKRVDYELRYELESTAQAGSPVRNAIKV